MALTRARVIYHVPAEAMQRIQYIQNNNPQFLNQYQQQQQHGQGYEQQGYNIDQTYQVHQQGVNHQYQNHQQQNFQIGPKNIQTAQLSLHQVQAPQLQHQIQEEIVHQIQPQSHKQQILVPLPPSPHQDLQVQFEQTQLPQIQSHQPQLSYQVPTHQTGQSNQIQQLKKNINQGYDDQRHGRPEATAKVVGYKFEKGGPNYRYAFETENGEIIYVFIIGTKKLDDFKLDIFYLHIQQSNHQHPWDL